MELAILRRKRRRDGCRSKEGPKYAVFKVMSGLCRYWQLCASEISWGSAPGRLDPVLYYSASAGGESRTPCQPRSFGRLGCKPWPGYSERLDCPPRAWPRFLVAKLPH